MSISYSQRVKNVERMAGGFLAVVFTAFLSNITLDQRSGLSNYSLLALCVSVPFMFAYWIDYYTKPQQHRFRSVPIILLGVCRYLTGYVGLLLLIAHIKF